MGLDVYLYTKDERERDDAYDKASEELHAEGPDGTSRYDRMTEEERKQWREENKWVSSTDVPSEKYSPHLFNRRYLRSSYNEGGFNSAVPQMLGRESSLYWIFEPMGRDWGNDDNRALTEEDVPRLLECKARALEVETALRASDNLKVATISSNLFGNIPQTTDDEALGVYRETLARVGGTGGWGDEGYVTNGGNFTYFGKEGLTVLAALPGLDHWSKPAVHLVFRLSNEAVDSYAASAAITAEFCDEAIMLIQRDGSCFLSWSG